MKARTPAGPWVVAGSLCGGAIQKLANCWRCDFMNAVKKEETPAEQGFSVTRLGLLRVLEKKRTMKGTSPFDSSMNTDH